MKDNSQTKSNSFRAPLLELVIVIGIFAIVSVYLLRMFMAADKLQGTAVATTKGLVRAETLVEYMRNAEVEPAAEGSREAALRSKMIEEFDMHEAENSEVNLFTDLLIYYNKNWEVSEQESAYTLTYHLDSKLCEADNSATLYLEGYVKVTDSEGKTEYCRLPVVKPADFAGESLANSELNLDIQLGGSYEENR